MYANTFHTHKDWRPLARTYDTNVFAATLSDSPKECADSHSLSFSLSLSLTSSLLFWTWQQAVNGKNNEESFLTSSRYRSMNTRTLEHVGHQRTNERRERGEEHALFQVHSQGRHDFQVRITNECNREGQKCVCIHLFLCIDVACLCTLVCVFMCGGLAINSVRPDIQ